MVEQYTTYNVYWALFYQSTDMRTDNTNQLQYIAKLFAIEQPSQTHIRESTPSNATHMHISPIEGKLIYTLLKLARASTVVEIGSFQGYSTSWIARALPDSGKIITIEKKPENYQATTKNMSEHIANGKIETLQGDALTILHSIEKQGPFDAAFIDANKSAYDQYLQWAEKNIKKGGLIIADNTLLFDLVHTPDEQININNFPVTKATIQKMRAVNQRLADPNLYDSIIIPTQAGLTIAIKNF